jgi:hypothetical protein
MRDDPPAAVGDRIEGVAALRHIALVEQTAREGEPAEDEPKGHLVHDPEIFRRVGEGARSVKRARCVGERGGDPQLHRGPRVGGLLPAEKQAPHNVEKCRSQSIEALPACVVQQPDARVERGDRAQALGRGDPLERVFVDVARVRAETAPARSGLFPRVPVARPVAVEELPDIVTEERVAIEVEDLRELTGRQVVERQDLVQQRAERKRRPVRR